MGAVDILLVDDRPQNLDVLEAILASPDYRLLRATTANEALETILAHEPAAIVLDVKMPETSGLELARIIKGRKKTEHLPILFLTAHLHENQDVLAGYSAGAVDYLTKPVNPAILKAKIAVFAELYRKTQALAQRTVQLETANRELESLSYSVAHDLRAPLRSIDGFSQALLEDYADKLDKDGQQHLHYVRQSAQEMTKLIDGLLSLSHVTRCELRHERVDLSDLAHGIIAHLRRSAPTRSVETTVQHDIVVEGDRRLLRVVLENLIGNAWKFTQNRITGHIEFGAVGRGSHQVCFVRDNGAGFDMTYTAKLFGVFQRLHAATEFEGTGIGLATVHRIVTRHGGRVWAEGEVERGATFYFTLGDAPPDAGGTAS